jgi:hypothetical protein
MGHDTTFGMWQMARHHAVIRHEMGNAVNKRKIERRFLSVLAQRVYGYHHMSMGC